MVGTKSGKLIGRARIDPAREAAIRAALASGKGILKVAREFGTGSSVVQRIKAAAPDLIMQSSYLGDAILSMKTYKELGVSPDALLANDAGFNDSEFLKTMGKDGEFVLSREVWALDLTSRNPLIKQVNDLYLERYKTNFNGNSARTRQPPPGTGPAMVVPPKTLARWRIPTRPWPGGVLLAVRAVPSSATSMVTASGP